MVRGSSGLNGHDSGEPARGLRGFFGLVVTQSYAKGSQSYAKVLFGGEVAHGLLGFFWGLFWVVVILLGSGC